jgi:hypothetical protein
MSNTKSQTRKSKKQMRKEMIKNRPVSDQERKKKAAEWDAKVIMGSEGLMWTSEVVDGVQIEINSNKIETKKLNDVSADNLSGEIMLKFQLANNPTALSLADVKITYVQAYGPDEDGNIRVELKFEVINTSEINWDYLAVKTQIFIADGVAIEETKDNYEKTVKAGDTEEFEVNFFGSIKNKLFNNLYDQAEILLSVTGCGSAFEKIGEIAVPEASLEVTKFKPIKLENILQIVSGGIWKTEPDADKESGIQVAALVQNLTARYLYEVKVIAEVTNKSGKDVVDASSWEEVKPGDVCLITAGAYTKDKQFKGAIANLALRAYYPVSTGICQHSGIKIKKENNEE